MTSGQRDPVLRLAHARRHIESVSEQLEAFFVDDPWTVAVHQEAQENVVVLVGSAEVPARVALTVGDAINSMRSGLDNLVWQLALVSTSSPFERISWPVAKPDGPAVQPNDSRLRGLSAQACALILEMQPSQDERWLPLAHLERLWNDDKHRQLQLLTGYVGSPTGMVIHPVQGSPGLYAARYAETVHVGATKAGDVLLRLPVELEVDLNWDLTVGFSGGPVDGAPVMNVLTHLHQLLTKEVLPRFADLLPGLCGT